MGTHTFRASAGAHLESVSGGWHFGGVMMIPRPVRAVNPLGLLGWLIGRWGVHLESVRGCAHFRAAGSAVPGTCERPLALWALGRSDAGNV